MDDSFETNNELASFFRPPANGAPGSAPGRSESACRPETLTPDMTSRTFQGSPLASLPTFRRACHSSDGLENMAAFGGNGVRGVVGGGGGGGVGVGGDMMRDSAGPPFSFGSR